MKFKPIVSKVIDEGAWIDPKGKVYFTGSHYHWLESNQNKTKVPPGTSVITQFDEVLKRGWVRVVTNQQGYEVEARESRMSNKLKNLLWDWSVAYTKEFGLEWAEKERVTVFGNAGTGRRTNRIWSGTVKRIYDFDF